MKASAEQADRLHRFSHDLRNRLAALQQVLAQLADAPPDEREELMDFAEQQYFKAMRGMEALLDDFAVDRRPVVREPSPVQLDGLVKKALDALAYRFDRKQQRVDSARLETITVQGDERMLYDLISALISNASKFSGANTTITVSLTREDGKALLVVVDQGVGLGSEDLEQVFTRFALLKGRSTSGEAQGRSMLARARQWAEAHGGQLVASSDGEGMGSTFSLRLPLL